MLSVCSVRSCGMSPLRACGASYRYGEVGGSRGDYQGGASPGLGPDPERRSGRGHVSRSGCGAWDCAARAGGLVAGRDLDPDVTAAQVATCARARDWPVLAVAPARLRAIDPELTVQTLPGMS